ncbi:MAG: DUF427 domain-containing protein [Coriobacteriia bacterium]|nr:DUF427 domain-containing protein [Coriobacteriia bacterium]MBN2839363.1 DUF427 domain-containing protein [Coriobacteriia bacterium]
MNARRMRPGPGQESVWEYPRPPIVLPDGRLVEVVFGGRTIAHTTRALRVLETGHAPVFYIPVEDVAAESLVPGDRTSYCDFKGEARYFHVVAGERHALEAAWAYAAPRPGYEALSGHFAFYPAPMDRCLVDGEVVTPQPGAFRGGWVTSDIVGPFLGEPRTFVID